MRRLLALAATGIALTACEKPETQEHYDKRRAAEDYNAPCRDTSWLMATTVGSPNRATCPNRAHRMRVEAVTKAGEEIGAVAFCECQRHVPAASVLP